MFWSLETYFSGTITVMGILNTGPFSTHFTSKARTYNHNVSC